MRRGKIKVSNAGQGRKDMLGEGMKYLGRTEETFQNNGFCIDRGICNSKGLNRYIGGPKWNINILLTPSDII